VKNGWKLSTEIRGTHSDQSWLNDKRLSCFQFKIQLCTWVPLLNYHLPLQSEPITIKVGSLTSSCGEVNFKPNAQLMWLKSSITYGRSLDFSRYQFVSGLLHQKQCNCWQQFYWNFLHSSSVTNRWSCSVDTLHSSLVGQLTEILIVVDSFYKTSWLVPIHFLTAFKSKFEKITKDKDFLAIWNDQRWAICNYPCVIYDECYIDE
jgi:hypothetical protein